MTDGEIRGAVRAAGEHDTYVVAHSGESAAIRQALAQGVRCFEHAYRLDDDTAALLARPRHLPDPDAVRDALGVLDARQRVRRAHHRRTR